MLAKKKVGQQKIFDPKKKWPKQKICGQKQILPKKQIWPTEKFSAKKKIQKKNVLPKKINKKEEKEK